MPKVLIDPFTDINELSSITKLMFDRTNSRGYIYVIQAIIETVFMLNLISYIIYDYFFNTYVNIFLVFCLKLVGIYIVYLK